MSGVEIDRAIARTILAAAHASKPFEVGGVLLGPPTDGQNRITSLIGPGPNSRATRVSFEPDYDYQQAQLDELYERHGGHLAYVGDWHSHPTGACSPSHTDVRALLAIRSDVEARCPDPVMIICGGRTGRSFRAYRLDGVRAREVQVRYFDYRVELIERKKR